MGLYFQYEDAGGGIANFEVKEFSPLDLNELQRAFSRERTFTFEVSAVNISLTEGANVRDLGNRTIRMKIDLPNPIHFYCLDRHGWLPLPFTKANTILIDSNVLIYLERTLEGREIGDSQEMDWWLSLLFAENVSFNPLLYALEGTANTFPSLEVFSELLVEATNTIKSKLPSVNVIEFDSDAVEQVYEVLSKITDTYDVTNRFIIEAVPLIHQTASSRDLGRIQDQIFELASIHGQKLMSFPFLAVLSCLYEKSDGRHFDAARRILKPSASYSPEDAYNAMTDLRCLELYAATIGLSRLGDDSNVALCTSDKGLAAFGVALNPHDVVIDERGATFSVSINENLFPRLPENDRDQLLQRLIAG